MGLDACGLQSPLSWGRLVRCSVPKGAEYLSERDRLISLGLIVPHPDWGAQIAIVPTWSRPSDEPRLCLLGDESERRSFAADQVVDLASYRRGRLERLQDRADRDLTRTSFGWER